MLFTPVLTRGFGVGRRSLFDDESCHTETDKGKDGEKSEDPVCEDIYTTERLRVAAKVCEEPAGVRYDILFRWFLLLDGVLSEVCPCPSCEFPGRNVVSDNNKERYCCEERG